MKKTILQIAFIAITFIGFSSSAWAWETIKNFTVINLTLMDNVIKDRPRGPVYVPEVGQTDHTLFFPDETDLFLNIYSEDEDGELLLEYSTAVPAATLSITLPATLAGTFVIEVIRADQHFQGEIEL